MYGRAKTWTCQSLAKDVCKEQMPRCKFQSEMSEAVKAFLQKKITEQRHSEVGVYLQMEDWDEDDTSKLCWNVNSSNFAFYSSSFEWWVHLHGTIVLDIFFISPNSRPLPTFLPFPHGTRRRTQAWGPTPPVPSRDARRRPCTAELLQGARRTSVRIIRTRSPPCPTWRTSCGSRESWLRRGWGLSWREVVTFLEEVFQGHIFCVAKAWGLDSFFSISQYWLDCFLGRNTLLGLPSTFHSCNWQNENMACQIFRVNSCKWMQMRPIAYIGACWMKVWHLRHLRDARRRPCTAEFLQGAKRTSVRITRTRSAPWTTWRCFCSSRESWLRRGWGLWGERWPFWTFHQGIRPDVFLFLQLLD